MPQQTQSPKRDSVAAAALRFGSGTLTSRILGLFRDILMASIMPIHMKDAWIVAWRLPNFFRRLLGEGGLSVSFIPIFVELTEKGKDEERAQLVNGVFGLLMTLVMAICLVCFFFMEPLISRWVSGPGFTEIPGKVELTIAMARIMVFFLFFVTLFAFFMALLNGLKRFTLTGFAPMFLNVALIGALYGFADAEILPIAVAWAVLIGGAMQAFVLAPKVKALGVFPKFKPSLSNPAVKKVLAKFMPTVFAVGLLQIMGLINTYFASQLASGSNFYIYLGDRLLELPLSLIAVSIGTALLPTLSGYWAKGDRVEFVSTVSKNLSLFYFLALPAAAGLWFLGEDIVDVIFRRREFTVTEVAVVAGILKVYCLTLLVSGSLKITNQAFYATGDTLTPALIGVVGLIVHLFLAPVLMDLYAINGLVLSTACILALNLSLSLIIIQRRVGLLNWRKILPHFVLCSVATAFMALYLWSLQLIEWRKGHVLFDFPAMLGLIAFAGFIYFAVAFVLRIEEMQVLKRRFFKSK